MPLSLSTQRVLVTGGSGFLGSRVVAKLRERSVRDLVVVRSAEYDLVDRSACRRVLRDTHPDVVIHLAAVVGGIGANMENPGRYFHDLYVRTR